MAKKIERLNKEIVLWQKIQKDFLELEELWRQSVQNVNNQEHLVLKGKNGNESNKDSVINSFGPTEKAGNNKTQEIKNKEWTEEAELTSLIGEEAKKIQTILQDLIRGWQFTGQYDQGEAILTVQAGAGGTDAQDWAEMILRMYLRYAERKGWSARLLTQSKGAEAGIKNATVKMTGEFAYGIMKKESGVHRLVRLSPFNADHLRQTSFAAVEVVPVVEQEELELKDSDLKIDTFRSSGAGGQSVNKTDSAVRITHLPTGLVVTCQNERSQKQNKEQALSILTGKLAKILEEEQIKKLNELKGEKKAVEWGSQIRSYILHPYKMVKDHQSGKQISAVDKVLSGHLELINDLA